MPQHPVRALFTRSVLAALTLGTGLTGCGGGAGDTIVIGVTGPFTQPRGVSMKLGAELAMQEINAAGGIDGKLIELVFADDSASNDAAVRIATQFRADRRMVAVIGHLTSGPTGAAAPIYNGDGDPMALISPSASAPSLTTEGGRAVFRVCPTDFAHGQALARHARSVLNARTAAILYENDTYGRGVAANFVNDFRQLGGSIVGEDPYNRSISSFEPYLRRLQERGGADVILIAGTRDGAERILTTLETLRMTSTILAGDGVIGIEAIPRAEGMFVTSAWLADNPNPVSEAFVRAYATKNGGARPDHRGAGAYDIVHILKRAVETVGTDRVKIVEYLEGMGTTHPAYDGSTGRITFDADGEVKEKSVAVGVVRGRRLVTATP